MFFIYIFLGSVRNWRKYQAELPILSLPKMSQIRNESQLGTQRRRKKNSNNEEKSQQPSQKNLHQHHFNYNCWTKFWNRTTQISDNRYVNLRYNCLSQWWVEFELTWLFNTWFRGFYLIFEEINQILFKISFINILSNFMYLVALYQKNEL